MIENITISAWIDSGTFGVPETVALAAVAAFGYLFGRRSRRPADDPSTEQAQRELQRATSIAQELEQIAATIRRDLASHHSKVEKFKTKVAELSHDDQSPTSEDLCGEAERILSPTLQLATQLAHAYDQIRQQSTQLMDFAEIRTDPLTGVSNRRALDEQMEMMFATMNRYDRQFSICIIDIDHFKELNGQEGRLSGDQALQRITKLIEQSVRDTDIVARYGAKEFVIVMPQTGLAGACIFAERFRILIEEEMPLTISGGIAEAAGDDTQQSLLSRADSALYSAKANGRNCLFVHTGKLIRPHRADRIETATPTPAEPSAVEDAELADCKVSATV